MRSTFSAVLFGTLFAFTLSLGAAQWISKEAGVSLQLPSHPDWVQIKAENGVGLERVIFQRQDNTAVVQFTFSETYPTAQKLDDEYVQRWEKQHYRKHDDKKVSGEFITLKGQRAYRLCDQPNIEGQKRRSITILWLNNEGRLCSVFATRYEGDPLLDPVIKAFLDSLTLLPRAPK
ncbi:MAG TPA: hypothetical protein VJA21_17550 [Verrucomicrobiae bacterium]